MIESEILITTGTVWQVVSDKWKAPLKNPFLEVGTLREVRSPRHWAFYCLRHAKSDSYPVASLYSLISGGGFSEFAVPSRKGRLLTKRLCAHQVAFPYSLATGYDSDAKF